MGGCCGTTPAHIAAVDAMLRKRSGAGRRPAPVKRQVHWVPAVASLYRQVPLRQENAFLSIGERCNANGSKKLRELQERERLGRLRRHGPRAGRRRQPHAWTSAPPSSAATKWREMTEVITPLARHRQRAAGDRLHRDAGDRGGAEAVWRQGDHQLDQFRERRGAAQPSGWSWPSKFGAAVIALTIDEDGMAKERRATSCASPAGWSISPCNRHGLPQSDLLIDPLTFTICHRQRGRPQAGAGRWRPSSCIRDEFPDIQIILGLSNVSFGLKPAARAGAEFGVPRPCRASAGMTGAIVHVSQDPAAAPDRAGGGEGRPRT